MLGKIWVMVTMFHLQTRMNRFASIVGAASVCALALVAAVGTGQLDRARFQSGLQELADDAALAGVDALAGEQGSTEQDARHQAAFGASKTIIHNSGRTDLQRSVVMLSQGHLKVSVSLSAIEPPQWWDVFGAKKAVSVASTAQFTPADESANPHSPPRPLALPGQARPPLADASPVGSVRRIETQ